LQYPEAASDPLFFTVGVNESAIRKASVLGSWKTVKFLLARAKTLPSHVPLPFDLNLVLLDVINSSVLKVEEKKSLVLQLFELVPTIANTNESVSALKYAVDKDYHEILGVLLEAGVDHTQKKDGKHLIEHAFDHDQLACMRLLVNATKAKIALGEEDP